MFVPVAWWDFVLFCIKVVCKFHLHDWMITFSTLLFVFSLRFLVEYVCGQYESDLLQYRPLDRTANTHGVLKIVQEILQRKTRFRAGSHVSLSADLCQEICLLQEKRSVQPGACQ